MQDSSDSNILPMHMTRGCLVIPIQVELQDEAVLRIQTSVLERVQAKGIKGVVIDLSGVNIIDSFLGKTLSNTARMTTLLGATTVVTGLQPGVVASLVDLDLELDDIQTAMTLEDGLQILAPPAKPEAEEYAEDEEDVVVEEAEGAEEDSDYEEEYLEDEDVDAGAIEEDEEDEDE